MIEKMLQLDPDHRITAEEALAHPYMENFHEPEDEPVAEQKIDMSFDDAELSAEEWKKKMYVPFSCVHEGEFD